MKKRVISILILLMLLVASVGSFSGCKGKDNNFVPAKKGEMVEVLSMSSINNRNVKIKDIRMGKDWSIELTYNLSASKYSDHEKNVEEIEKRVDSLNQQSLSDEDKNSGKIIVKLTKVKELTEKIEPTKENDWAEYMTSGTEFSIYCQNINNLDHYRLERKTLTEYLKNYKGANEEPFLDYSGKKVDIKKIKDIKNYDVVMVNIFSNSLDKMAFDETIMSYFPNTKKASSVSLLNTHEVKFNETVKVYFLVKHDSNAVFITIICVSVAVLLALAVLLYFKFSGKLNGKAKASGKTSSANKTKLGVNTKPNQTVKPKQTEKLNQTVKKK